jgi:SAM-dependent methyltransferase
MKTPTCGRHEVCHLCRLCRRPAIESAIGTPARLQLGEARTQGLRAIETLTGRLWRGFTRHQMAKAETISSVCDAEDFFKPELLDIMRTMQMIPSVNRKQWEYVMNAHAMQASGALHDQADVLGLACEVEPVIYYAANKARSVLATDLYAGSGNSPGWAAGRLREADVFERSAFPYPRERLKVRTMDMRRIEAKDESFDLVWSSSSIEHLGSTAEIRASLREVARVLRPGGVHVLTTEWKLCGGFSYFPHSFIFDSDLLNRMLADVPLEPLGPFDARFSTNPLNIPVWRGLSRALPELPHVVLYSRGVLNTSMLVALRKSNRTGHVFDFIPQDPAVDEWLTERYRRIVRTVASPLTRARLLVDGTLGSWLAAAQHRANERRAG